MPSTIQAAAAEIRQGKVTPVDLLNRCLERIDRFDERIRAWVLVDQKRARAEAEACTAELARGEDRGPLHGIPLGIKDIIDVFDWPTACGSRRWKDSIARRDAPAVQKLRQAGAVLIGKTVTTQYASFDPSPTRNPWNLSRRTPGRPSSGSAAAVACGMCMGALASQTGGSITRPASYCGVASFKPSFGSVPLEGVLPLAHSMDHLGCMARSVRDVALLAQTLNDAGAYPGRDVESLLQFGSDVGKCDWIRPLNHRLQAPVLGRLRGLFERLASPAVLDMMDRICAVLVQRGARIEEVDLPVSFDEVVARHRVVMAVEAAFYHAERLRRYPEDYGPCITTLLEEGIACPAEEYHRCKRHQEELQRTMLGCIGSGIDAWICPATTVAAPDAAMTGDPAFNSPWSYTGLPVVSFPVARDADGLPLAVQIVGHAWAQGRLFGVAAWCEDAVAFDPGEPPAL